MIPQSACSHNPTGSIPLNTGISTNTFLCAQLSSSGYTSVVGTIIVPTPKSTGKTASASAWVGIDGDTCGTAILQTGLDFSITSGGSVSYDAW